MGEVGRNLIIDPRRWRRIATASPNFRHLVTLGIYSAFGAIIEIGGPSRPEMAHRVEESGEYRRNSTGASIGLGRCLSLGVCDSDFLGC